jgi:hypothetical protein
MYLIKTGGRPDVSQPTLSPSQECSEQRQRRIVWKLAAFATETAAVSWNFVPIL